MDIEHCEKLSKIILTDSSKRYCEIYIITNTVNNNIYIGKAVSHILNHKKYRPYGSIGRFKTHISEAFSNKKNQCHYLNNSIRKYGKDSFKVELLEYCNIDDSNDREIYYINKHNSLYPNGYNLKLGGNIFSHCEESKKRVSEGVYEYYKHKKYERFRNIEIIDDDVEKYIKPLKRNNIQYGWYVYIDKLKADFGGVHISLEESKNRATQFIINLKNNYMAKQLVAGSS
jgi:hypothetical protein